MSAKRKETLANERKTRKANGRTVKNERVNPSRNLYTRMLKRKGFMSRIKKESK